MPEEVTATAEAEELAEKHGVDLSEVKGTGTDGKVLKGNVQDFLDARETEEAEPEPEIVMFATIEECRAQYGCLWHKTCRSSVQC